MAKEYVAETPGALVLGSTMRATLNALGEQALPIMAEHGLSDVQDNEWYLFQNYLDVIKKVAQGGFGAMQDLVAIGMLIPDVAILPPEVDTLEQVLAGLGITFTSHHKDAGIGWEVRQEGNTTICDSYTPYPDEMEYGVLYSFARHFTRPGQNFTVQFDSTLPRKATGGDFTRILVTMD